MRKTGYTFALILAIALTGCVKEELSSDDNANQREITFRVQREQDCLTRAALANGNSITFQEGDKISIFDGNDENCVFTQTGEIGADGSATFTGKVGMVADSYLALYPYMPDVKVAEGKIGTYGEDNERLFIPAEQKAVEDSFDPLAFISAASSVRKSNSEHLLTFHNACALVKFTVPDNIDGLTFEKAVLRSSYMLAGAIRVNPDGTSDYAGPGSSTITLTGTMKSGHSYYFCARADEIQGLSLQLYHYPNDESPVVVKATAQDRMITLERNRVLDLGTIEVTNLPDKTAGWYGDGTEANPYQISAPEDLSLLLNRLANGEDPHYRGLYYRMTDDIDCEGQALIEDQKRVEFCGVFDGNGHTLSNYTGANYYEPFSDQQPHSIYDYFGLFHRVYRATFKNLIIRPADMTAELHSHSYISPFVAVADDSDENKPTVFENCRIEGDFNLSFCNWGDFHFGGFVGFNYCEDLRFVNCCNNADFTFSEYWYSETDEEGHLYEYGIADNTGYNIGGFVGSMYNKDSDGTTDLNRCRNRGDISFKLNVPGSHIHCGGFIGSADYAFLYPSTYSITNCVNSGDIDVSPGNSCGSICASGFIGFSQIDGYNHAQGYTERHLATPRIYNCLNKGSVSAIGSNAHAAGFLYYRKFEGSDNNTQVRLCINIGPISAQAPESSERYAAAISSNYGNCRWCWRLDSTPLLPMTIKGDPSADTQNIDQYPYYCMHYPTINADTPNNRRIGSNGKGGSDIVLNENNSQWTNEQWIANTVQWTGGSRDGSLDLDF